MITSPLGKNNPRHTDMSLKSVKNQYFIPIVTDCRNKEDRRMDRLK